MKKPPPPFLRAECFLFKAGEDRDAGQTPGRLGYWYCAGDLWKQPGYKLEHPIQTTMEPRRYCDVIDLKTPQHMWKVFFTNSSNIKSHKCGALCRNHCLRCVEGWALCSQLCLHVISNMPQLCSLYYLNTFLFLSWFKHTYRTNEYLKILSRCSVSNDEELFKQRRTRTPEIRDRRGRSQKRAGLVLYRRTKQRENNE